MLRAIPKGWWTLDYELFDGERPVGQIEFKFGSEDAIITIGSDEFLVRSEGWIGRTYFLETRGGQQLASAEKPLFSSGYTLTVNNRTYSLERDLGFMNPNYSIVDGTGAIGSITPDSILSHKSTIELPANIPLQMQAFIFLLVAMTWKSSSDASVAAT